jgi:hypothetical protein
MGFAIISPKINGMLVKEKLTALERLSYVNAFGI